MSTTKTGQISGLQVVKSEKVWRRSKNGKHRLDKSNYELFGKVDRGCCGFVCTAVNTDSNNRFKEDFVNTPATTKNSIANFFLKTKNGNSNKRKVAYLVRVKKAKS